MVVILVAVGAVAYLPPKPATSKPAATATKLGLPLPAPPRLFPSVPQAAAASAIPVANAVSPLTSSTTEPEPAAGTPAQPLQAPPPQPEQPAVQPPPAVPPSQPQPAAAPSQLQAAAQPEPQQPAAPPQQPTLPSAPGGDIASPIVVGNVGSPKTSRAIDFPDPFVLRVGPSAYYAYSTGNFFGDRIQVIESTDKRATWNYVGDAFTGGGSGWSDLPPGNTWGPSVFARADGKYVLYYSSLSKVPDATNGKQCIGRAVSASPAGPFIDEETAPLLCTPWLGGSIDPSPLLDNGNLYLIWKSEGIPSPNYVPTQVWSVGLTGDGLSTSGGSTALLTTDDSSGSWEFPIIEGPTMMKNPGAAGYVLLYSAYEWATADYKVGAASCATPIGPCTRTYSTPILPRRGDTVGPGGASVFQDSDGNWWVAFHAWNNPFVGYVPFDPRYARSLRILPLTFPGGSPKIG